MSGPSDFDSFAPIYHLLPNLCTHTRCKKGKREGTIHVAVHALALRRRHDFSSHVMVEVTDDAKVFVSLCYDGAGAVSHCRHCHHQLSWFRTFDSFRSPSAVIARNNREALSLNQGEPRTWWSVTVRPWWWGRCARWGWCRWPWTVLRHTLIISWQWPQHTGHRPGLGKLTNTAAVIIVTSDYHEDDDISAKQYSSQPSSVIHLIFEE